MPCEDYCSEEIEFSGTGSSISCPKSHWKSVEDEGACFLIFLESQASVLAGPSFSAQTFPVLCQPSAFPVSAANCFP